ncbi:MAG: energy transducer TonB [Prevotella sp.]|nr:energy transducer TonB [Prevotella sp.]
MMEVKKSRSADLERRRPAWLAMGLAFALACFVIAIEFSFNEVDGMLDADFLDEIAEDMEFIPPLDMPLPKEETQENAPSEKIEVVQEVYENESKEEETMEMKPELAVEEEMAEENVEDKVEAVLIDQQEEEVKTIRELDDLPVFPGGMSQLVRWLTQNLKYPETAKNDKVSGKVKVSFVVNADGTVSDIKLVKSAEQRLDKEALRVVRMMPKWQPGLINGKPCRTLVNLPVVFKL